MGPAKICDQVYLIGGSSISHTMDCCVYLIDTGKLVMIDTGAGKSIDRLVDNINSLGLIPENLTTVIVTHAHIDHIGSLLAFKQRFGVKIIAHEGDVSSIETGKHVGAEYYGVDYQPCKVDEVVTGEKKCIDIGDTAFEILHIPGHTPGSIVVTFNSKNGKVLFGQDIHGPYHKMWGGDPLKALISLQKLRSLKADILCEGHFGVIMGADRVESFIQEYIDFLDN
jgi:glyoxylase-like metal-dependent hydrolase (beta-lactamase superfamily II)